MDFRDSIGIFLCHSGNGQAGAINFGELITYVRKNKCVSVVWDSIDYPVLERNILNSLILEKRISKLIIAGYSTGMIKSMFSQAIAFSGKESIEIILIDFREQGIYYQNQIDLAKALLFCAIYGESFEEITEAYRSGVKPDTVIIGGGIAGMQASLEIANSGNKVYLVEREGTIGGHMAMFDKTFPTLDCAACILTPKMVQVGQHPNIKLLTLSEVQEVTGTAGNFMVKIKTRPRFVTGECTGCGDCITSCPVQNQPKVQPAPQYTKYMKSEEIARLEGIISGFKSSNNGKPARETLIQIMHEINNEFNYLPENALKYLGQVMELPLSQVYHVATFYTAFSLIPRGEHIIKVCMGTACHSRGGPEILERFKSILGIKPDETTEDGKFSLHTVKCFGCCALGPVVNIGDQYYQTTLIRVAKMIDHFNKGKSHAKTTKHKRAGIL